MNKKLKILFIPADNLSSNVSRSYFIANNLAKHSELYFITWFNHRSVLWEGKKTNHFNTIICFFKSLFRFFDIEQKRENEHFFRVNTSVFVDAIIGRIFGNIFTKKIMRIHNGNSLKRVVKRIKPDVIINADAFYFFPSLNLKSIINIADFQDDTDWIKYNQDFIKYETKYRNKQLTNCNLCYIVSENAIQSVKKNIGDFNYIPLPNGADFSGLQSNFSKNLSEIKQKYNLENKFIITYIGSDIWLDVDFTYKLFNKIYETNKEIVLLLVGNLPKIELPNIIQIGSVPSIISYHYYQLSDVGILLKDPVNSDFLYNAVPLKMIQYSAVQKPIITFPIKWSEDYSFNNIFHIKSNEINDWVSTILKIKEFKWEKSFNEEWENYDWDVIAQKILKDINTLLNK